MSDIFPKPLSCTGWHDIKELENAVLEKYELMKPVIKDYLEKTGIMDYNYTRSQRYPSPITDQEFRNLSELRFMATALGEWKAKEAATIPNHPADEIMDAFITTNMRNLMITIIEAILGNTGRIQQCIELVRNITKDQHVIHVELDGIESPPFNLKEAASELNKSINEEYAKDLAKLQERYGDALSCYKLAVSIERQEHRHMRTFMEKILPYSVPSIHDVVEAQSYVIYTGDVAEIIKLQDILLTLRSLMLLGDKTLDCLKPSECGLIQDSIRTYMVNSIGFILQTSNNLMPAIPIHRI